MWWWLLSTDADASQLAVDRFREGLVVVTTWHLRPEIWWIPEQGGAPVRTVVDEVATNPTISCGAKGCDIGWIRLLPNLDPPDRWPGASWAWFDRKGLGSPQPLGGAGSLTTRVMFVPGDPATEVYAQTMQVGPTGRTWVVGHSTLRKGELAPASPLAEPSRPGLFLVDGQVRWRDREVQVGRPSLDNETLLYTVRGDAILPFSGGTDQTLVTLSPGRDAAVWATEAGVLQAGWVAAGRVTGAAPVETVDPRRAAHVFMESFVSVFLGNATDGRVPLTIPVNVSRTYVGVGALTVALGEDTFTYDLVERSTERPGTFWRPSAGEARLETTTTRDDELSPEAWRWDYLSAALPPQVLPAACADPEPVDLLLRRGPGGEDVWELTIQRGYSLDGRMEGVLRGPLPGEGDALAGTVVFSARCGGGEVPVRVHWTLGTPLVRETLQAPKPLGGPF